MASVIELQRITKQYSGSVVAVDDVSLSVDDGEFVTLLGPSGCGKSTLLRMIGGFEKPTRGTIRLADRDVTWEPPYRRAVNMVFQDYALFPHMTVGQNIAYGLKLMKLDRATIDARLVDALKLVGLSDKIDQQPHQLSGGQRQRVALARAVVRRPKVLLLDEPLSALDAKLREHMQLELKHLHEKVGITFIMVTHDQTEALVMSDRVVVMESGRVAQDGRPDALYDHPATPYVANFIGTTNFLDARTVSGSGASLRLHAAGVEWEALVDTAFPVGRDVTLAFRPEKARFLAEGESAENMVGGVVEEVVYLGLGLRVAVAMPDGSRVFVDSLLSDRLSNSRVPERGSPVRLSVAPRNVFVFDKETAR